MKKIIGVVLAAVALTSGMFAQVMKSTGVKNVLSTGFGNHDDDTTDDTKSKVDFDGFVDSFQVRYNMHKFSLESGLTWAIRFHDERDAYAKFGCEDYYVNFFVNPVSGLDIGAGTRLNWHVGEAPNAGSSWMPRAHVVQGGLAETKPTIDNVYTVSGFTSYANRYSSPIFPSEPKLFDAAIGIRYQYEDLFQIGLTLPDAVDTNHFYVNAAFEINPVDFLSAAVAYAGIGRSEGDLYVGTSLYFKNLTLDAYVGVNFREPSHDKSNNVVGWGVASTISIPSINMTLRPEVGFTDYLHPDYSFAWYVGNRLDLTLGDVFNIGFWFSYAGGAHNKKWADVYPNKNYDGGRIISVSPDITWKINKNHSLSIAYEYKNEKKPTGRTSSDWNVNIGWTYVY